MSDMTITALHADLKRIAKRFKNPRITLIVRNPDVHDGDVVLTDDDPALAMAALEHLWTEICRCGDRRKDHPNDGPCVFTNHGVPRGERDEHGKEYTCEKFRGTGRFEPLLSAEQTTAPPVRAEEGRNV
jgi:hypothetical protein